MMEACVFLQAPHHLRVSSLEAFWFSIHLGPRNGTPTQVLINSERSAETVQDLNAIPPQRPTTFRSHLLIVNEIPYPEHLKHLHTGRFDSRKWFKRK